MGCWYEDHFQEDYLLIYKHRSELHAESELANLWNHIPFKEELKVLDLCCGSGRQSRWLSQKGYQVTGVDLSSALLGEAEKYPENERITYMKTDMREITFQEEFDVVVNLFTSFGYFDQEEENETVLKRVHGALKNGGYFLFDFLNPTFLQSNLVAFSSHTDGELTINQYRRVEGDTIVKRINVKDPYSQRNYEERVKLYSYQMLREMLERNGLMPLQVFGDYSGDALCENTSPRVIFLCQKNVEEGIGV